MVMNTTELKEIKKLQRAWDKVDVAAGYFSPITMAIVAARIHLQNNKNYSALQSMILDIETSIDFFKKGDQ